MGARGLTRNHTGRGISNTSPPSSDDQASAQASGKSRPSMCSTRSIGRLNVWATACPITAPTPMSAAMPHTLEMSSSANTPARLMKSLHALRRHRSGTSALRERLAFGSWTPARSLKGGERASIPCDAVAAVAFPSDNRERFLRKSERITPRPTLRTLASTFPSHAARAPLLKTCMEARCPWTELALLSKALEGRSLPLPCPRLTGGPSPVGILASAG